MIRVLILLFGLVSMISCGNNDKRPSGILEPKKMQAVLLDIIKADVYTNEFIKKDSTKDPVAENIKLQQQVFALHKTTKADFYKSYDYYQSHTAAFKVMLDSMVAVAERNKNPNIVTPLLSK